MFHSFVFKVQFPSLAALQVMIYERHTGRFMHIQILPHSSSLHCSRSLGRSSLMNRKTCVITRRITLYHVRNQLTIYRRALSFYRSHIGLAVVSARELPGCRRSTDGYTEQHGGPSPLGPGGTDALCWGLKCLAPKGC